MAKEKSPLEELKRKYEKLQKEHKLPSFQELNENFEIEKSAEHETDYLMREIRKSVVDKIIAYLRFIEMLLNPSNAPMFFFAIVKGLTPEDKKALEDLYGRLGSFEIDIIELDCKYDEKKEAEFVRKVVKEWPKIIKEMNEIIKVLRKNWNQTTSKGDRGYCG